ncbi:hypothetical protein GN958_ATG05564 [Phytophthora infestans]|uniref:Uncharacterized protein n=1 Tax=Phytophthora infestans TaxID=4787 RepID=A0A8S9V1L5_PHYIN|nr:hypothetical protein GN958_ATG05564 [Phytophthora infestans]
MEAEHVAAAVAMKEAIWVKQLLVEIGLWTADDNRATVNPDVSPERGVEVVSSRCQTQVVTPPIGSEEFDENKVVIKMSIVMTVVMGPRVLWRYRRSTAVRSGRSKREELEIYKNEGELNAFADYRTRSSDGKEDASFLYVR